MPTLGELYRDIGIEIGDPSNANTQSWQLLIWINKALEDINNVAEFTWATARMTGMYRIDVLTYGDISGNIITLKTSADSAATVYTEGVDWTAETGNSVTATNIATALDAHSNVEAYSSGDYVYILVTGGYSFSTLSSDADTSDITINDSGYEVFSLPDIISGFNKVKQIYDLTNKLIYRSQVREYYDRYLIDSGNLNYFYYVSPSHKLYIQASGGNLKTSNSFYIDYTTRVTALSAASDTLPVSLTGYGDLIVRRVVFYYFRSLGEYQRAQYYDIEYRRMIHEYKRDMIRGQGVPLTQEQFYESH